MYLIHRSMAPLFSLIVTESENFFSEGTMNELQIIFFQQKNSCLFCVGAWLYLCTYICNLIYRVASQLFLFIFF